MAFQFVCPVRYRSVFEKAIDRWTCYDIYKQPKLNDYDWFPILCIQFNLTYILGNFYSPDELNAFISNNNQFLTVLQSLFTSSYNYQASLQSISVSFEKFCLSFFKKYIQINLDNQNSADQNYPCIINAASSYTYGQCLIQADTNGIVEDFLRFPQAKNSMSSCLFDTPVRYLSSDNRIFCQVQVDTVNYAQFKYISLNGKTKFMNRNYSQKSYRK